LDRVWEIRNKVVHPLGRRPEREEVEIMIDYIERIAAPWENSASSLRKIRLGKPRLASS
jgi:hypothetical protein